MGMPAHEHHRGNKSREAKRTCCKDCNSVWIERTVSDSPAYSRVMASKVKEEFQGEAPPVKKAKTTKPTNSPATAVGMKADLDHKKEEKKRVTKPALSYPEAAITVTMTLKL